MAVAVDERRDRHLIIGAGFCGLGVAAAFTRRGVAFDLVDADVDVGGNWRHGVYERAHIISSRRTTEYSDWPMPGHWPDFPSAEQMLRYLEGYADHWGLRARVETQKNVAAVTPEGEGSWRVRFESGEERVYGGIVVCNGHHWDKRFPEIPGRFSGVWMHGKDYKRADILKNQRVLVIGGGNTACDVASDAAREGKSAHISLRRGYWFLPKTMLGVPTVELLKPWVPLRAQRWMIKSLVRVVVGRYENYGLPKPDHEPFEHHPTINSELLHHLRHGRLTPHPDVAKLDGTTVHFVDGSQIDVDVIVCCTGYHASFPFLPSGMLRYRKTVPQLIGGMLIPGQKNLYIFGAGQPRYGAGPLITAGAEVLATMVVTQAKLTAPLADVLTALGQRPARSMLQDPFAVLRRSRQAQRLLPNLPRLVRWIPAARVQRARETYEKTP